MSSALARVNAAYKSSVAQRPAAAAERKSFSQPPFWSLPDWTAFSGGFTMPDRERIENDYLGYIRGAYKSNGIVASCITARQEIFSQVRFGWREFRNLRPGDLFPSAELSLLEKPWGNATTIDLLTRMEVVQSLAGNWYGTKCDDQGRIGKAATGSNQRIIELRPDWVTIIVVSPSDDYWDPRARIGGYLYEPMGNFGSGRTPSSKSWLLMADEVSHFCADEETEILTADGWKDFRSLTAGEEVLTLNHETGMTQWQPVTEVCVFPAQRRDMVLMEGREFSSLTTLDHRWPIEKKNSKAGRYERRWATSATLNTSDRIPVAGYCADVPVDPKWTDALVEAVGWFWTEGSYKSGRRPGTKGRGIRIAQSHVKNIENVERIRAALTNLFGPPVARMSKRGPRADAPQVWRESVDGDIILFSLSANASDVITQHAPGKVPTTEFIRSLTQSQLELFIKVSWLADNAGERKLAQKDKAAAEQFALACILAGHAVSIREVPARKPYDYQMTMVRFLKSRHVYPQESKRPKSRFRVEHVTYDGQVWCPRTPNETWLARRKGSVYFTGNSTKPDPEARFRGMSWLTPIVKEIQADKAATTHKERFFKSGAQLGVIVKFDKDVGVDAVNAFIERFKASHVGEENAYSTLFLGGGADVTIATADMKQVDFKNLAGGGESRVASMAGIHPTIAGFSEGLQGSSLNQGNFGAARRLVADKTARHWWGTASSSLQTLLTPPNSRASLWYETRDVAFLREDLTDVAAIQSQQAQTIRTLSDAGYIHDSIIAALVNEDWTLLRHSGLYSVQLIPPGQAGTAPNPAAEQTAIEPPAASSNGNNPKPRESIPAQSLAALPAGMG